MRSRLLVAGLALALAAPSYAPGVSVPGDRSRPRILHLGDSHVAAEPYAAALRAHFAERSGAGEGGLFLPDLLPAGKEGAGRLRLDARWKVVHPRSADGGEADLAGGWAETSARGATLRLSAPFADGRLLLLRQPGGGTAAVRVDGRESGTVRLAGPSGLEVVRLPGAGGREVELVAGGDGPVRFLGAFLDSGRPGALYLPVGVNGAIASSLLRIPEPLFADQLRAVEPDLVLLSFGTNEARTFEPEGRLLSEQMGSLVSRVRRALPAARVIVVGPPDQARRTRSGTVAPVPARELVSRSFETAARQQGALFVDLAAAMGGAGSVRAWSAERPALVQEDLVHFTSAGYLRLARLLAGAIEGRETMIRIPAVAAAPEGGIRFERDSSGRIRLTNLPSSPDTGPLLGKRRKQD